MWCEMLHSFYRMPVTIYVGGRPVRTWVRWYKAPPGAKKLPFPSFIYSRVWSQPHQDDGPELGERGFPRVWTRGSNPGFQGQNYIGQPEWFMTGELPESVLTDPLPDVPAWCCIPPAGLPGKFILKGAAVGSGGLPSTGGGKLVIGGAAVGADYPPSTGGGKLVIGGAAVGADYPPSTGGGKLVIGGAAVGADYPPSTGGGKLVIGGAAVCTMASGPPPSAVYYSGSNFFGAEVTGCDQCPDGAAAQFTADLGAVSGSAGCSAIGGAQTFSYNGACEWTTPVIDTGSFLHHWILTVSAFVVTVSDLNTGITWQASRAGWDCKSPLVLPRTQAGVGCVAAASSITLFPV
jgi:hypothetical protein